MTDRAVSMGEAVRNSRFATIVSQIKFVAAFVRTHPDDARMAALLVWYRQCLEEVRS
jgi:hypothetical protein